MTDRGLIEQHYEAVDEGLRLSKSRARKLEFDTTLHFLDKHMVPKATILELGAGHGAYSLHYARRGHRVLATDLLETNVQTIQEHLEDEGLTTIEVRQADATRLESLSDRDFQAVLCLGPYYHCRTREARRRCLLECRRVVADRGLVAVAYVNRLFAIGNMLQRGVPLRREHYESLLQVDNTKTDYPDSFFNAAHFTSPEAVEAEVRSCGFEVIEHLGSDGPYDYFPSALDTLDEEAFYDFFSYHLKTCAQAGQRGASHHGLVLLRKV